VSKKGDFVYLHVRPVSVVASSVDAGIVPALVDVDTAVRPLEAFVAHAAGAVASGHALAAAAARIVGAVVHLRTVASRPADGAGTRVLG